MDDNKLKEALTVTQMYRDYLELNFGKVHSLDTFENNINKEAKSRNIRVILSRLVVIEDIEKKLISAFISGGVKMALNAHGPINNDNFTSAVKRIVGFVSEYLKNKDYGRRFVKGSVRKLSNTGQDNKSINRLGAFRTERKIIC